MARLFQRRNAAVTSIPGEDDVDPELLENPADATQTPDTKDFRTEAGANLGASRYSSASQLTFVDPESPEWAPFLERLRATPTGTTVRTEDGHTFVKQPDGSLESGIFRIFPDEMEAAADHGFPPMAIV